MASWFVDSVGWTAVTAWAALTAYNVGDLRRQLAAPAVDSERVFRCTIAGTSLAAEPAWNLTKGSTTAEAAGPTWTEVTGNSTYNWAAPHARLKTVCDTWVATGDRVYVGDDHAETTSAALLLRFQGTAAIPLQVWCVDHTKATPGAGDLRATATVTTTGASALTFGVTGSISSVDLYGIAFNCGTGASAASISYGNNNLYQSMVMRACKLTLGTTSVSSRIIFGGISGRMVQLIDTSLEFGSVSQSVLLSSSQLRCVGLSIVGSVVPTALFISNNSILNIVQIEDSDLSFMTSGSNLFGASTGAQNTGMYVVLLRCKLASGVVVIPTINEAEQVDLLQCDSAGTTYRSSRYRYEGVLLTETILIRTGGATDGVTPIAWKIATPSTARWYRPFDAFPVTQNNQVTAANVTLTMYGIWDAAALPNNDDVWMDTEYFGSAASPLGSIALGTKADPLAANAALTADTSAWDSLVTARANSTAYTLGQMRKVASNPGRVFFCTTAGTSAGSEPAGYASAVDGGSVTDGGAVFRAGVRFKQAITVSSPQPAMVGNLRSIVRAAKASSTFYIDPQIQLDALTYTRDVIGNAQYWLEQGSSSGGGGGGSINPQPHIGTQTW